jgi:hypothetical protein
MLEYAASGIMHCSREMNHRVVQPNLELAAKAA